MISPFTSRYRLLLLAATGALLVVHLTGCATPCWHGCSANFGGTLPVAAMLAAPTKLSAVGYGSSASYAQYTSSQQKLLAMRAARLDAYRNLAEQIYGFRISGSTSIAAFATQSDTLKSYVDATIRGAKVVSSNAIADGNYEVTVEMELSPQFFGCLRGAECGSAVAAAVLPQCGGSSCI